jgi:hypothetical protein
MPLEPHWEVQAEDAVASDSLWIFTGAWMAPEAARARYQHARTGERRTISIASHLFAAPERVIAEIWRQLDERASDISAVA